ncbi:MAG: aminotransferase class III-fold pyridoxal phosphate-dependent enzyme [Thermoprotei archaeon]
MQDSGKLDFKSVSEVNRELTFGTWRKQSSWKPLVVTGAEGVYFFDAEGKRYLDFSSQLMCSNLGHGNKRVVEAIRAQAEKLAYINPAYATEVRAELALRLREVLPQGLVKYFFGTSGTEANEAAVKMIRMYYSREGKTKIVSRFNSYHGSTASSINLTGDFRRVAVDAQMSLPGFVRIPDPYCYRCPFGLKYPECGVACAEYLEYVIRNEGNVGGVVVEPVTGTNGVIVPPKEYLPRIREITKEHDVFLVADEVMSGWGRTGEWFAVDNWGVKPDILTTAKGITAAYVPLSLTAVNKELADYFEDHYFAHGHTYEAHPLTLAAGVAAIDEYRERDLIRKSKELGVYLGKRLSELGERHPSVGDVRGIGLFWAVEIVRDRGKKTPFNTYEDKLEGRPLMTDRVASQMMKNGVYINSWVSHFVVAPPLIISREEIDRAVEVFDDSLKVADQEVTHA